MTRTYCCRSGGPNKGKGFALLIVLFIAVVGLAMTGLLAQVMTVSSASGRVASAEITKSNLLQSALEEGKGLLKEVMDNKNPALRYFHNKSGNLISETTDITSVKDLYLADPSAKQSAKPLGYKKDRNLDKAALGPLGIFGDSGSLTVRIYDMQYDPKLVKVSPAEIEFLPPATNIKETGFNEESSAPDQDRKKPPLSGFGIYLVRATLSIKGPAPGSDKTWILDSAIVQSSRL
jgi:hypothetical protein